MKRQDTRSPGVSCGRHVELCDRELHLSENMHGDTEVQTGTFEGEDQVRLVPTLCGHMNLCWIQNRIR